MMSLAGLLARASACACAVTCLVHCTGSPGTPADLVSDSLPSGASAGTLAVAAGGGTGTGGHGGNASPAAGSTGVAGLNAGTGSGGLLAVGGDVAAWPRNPDDPRTEPVPGGDVQLGWAALDIGQAANYDGGDAANPESCPDPDAMLTPGTVHFENGVWTLTGSGEGFIHGWDQGYLVYFKTKISGDFTFTMKVDKFEMLNGKALDGAAQALLNVRQDLGFKQPTHSIVAGASPNRYLFMARYSWAGDGGKWWHWPAFPDTWPTHRELTSWTRVVARGDAISAETSSDGVSWQAVQDNDQNAEHPSWYPFRLPELAESRYVGLVCSARNDRNYAPLVSPPGKTASGRDPESAQLRGAARCVFSHVTLTQP